MTLHGHVGITHELNAAMGELRSGNPAYAHIIERVLHYMQAKLPEMAAVHGGDRHRYSFGLSGAGGCVRKAAIPSPGLLEAMGIAFKEVYFSPGKLWQFAIGHFHEPWALALLEHIGFTVVEPQAEVTIPGDYPEFPLFHSWTDGIIERDGVRYSLSIKTMGMKNASMFRGKVSRRGFVALPFEGKSEGWRAQSQLEMYGLGIAKNLTVVLSKDYIEAFETEDPYCREIGSAVVWADVMDADTAWVDGFLLPTWKRAQRELVEGRLPDGAILDKASGMFKPTDPRVSNTKAHGWDWDRCKWSTGSCDMREACLAAYAKEAERG